MRERGRVTEVEEVHYGTVLTAAVGSGASALPVEDAGFPFTEAGGSLRVIQEDGTTYSYDYVSADPVTDVITLSAAAGVALNAEDRVVPDPEIVEKLVHALVDEERGEVVLATVPHVLYDKLQSGIRDEDGTDAESVVLEKTGESSEWFVVEIPGSAPIVDGSFLLESTIPFNASIIRNPYNAAENPGFENGGEGWELLGPSNLPGVCKFEQGISDARNGVGYLTFPVSLVFQPAARNLAWLEVVSGDFVFVRGYLKTKNLIGAPSIRAFVSFLDEAGDVIATNHFEAVPGAAYVVGQGYAVAPDGARYAAGGFGGQGDIGASADVFVDDFFLGFGAPQFAQAQVAVDAFANPSDTRSNVAYGPLAGGESGPEVTVIAPPSGRVAVEVSARIRAAVAGSPAWMSYQIWDVDAAAEFAPSHDNYACSNETTNGVSVERERIRSGLTPGIPYRFRSQYRRDGTGAATFIDRGIVVTPV